MKIPLLAGLLALCFLFIPQKSPHLSERSPSSENCLELVAEIISPKVAKLPIGVNSLFDRYPQLIGQMEGLIFHDIHFDEFYADFLKIHKRAPTLRDGIEHTYKVRSAILKQYDLIITDLNAINDAQLNLFKSELIGSRQKLTVFKDLDQLDAEIKASNAHGKTTLKNLDETITLKDQRNFEDRYFHYLKERTGQSNFHGEYGELFAMGSSGEKVITRGLIFKASSKHLANDYEQEILQSVARLRTVLETKSNDELIKLIKGHGKGLLRRAQEYVDETPAPNLKKSEMVEHIINMIKTKEIDLVTSNGSGTYTWAEVKAYKKVITPELLKDSHGKKSIFEQLLEHKALRDLLGLKNKVKLSFISPNTPISPEAKKLLASIGFSSLGAQ